MLFRSQEQAIDVRIISATHKDIEEEVRAGRFRQDLFYRLNVINLWVAPLRERREDLPDLCEHLLGKIATESGATEQVLGPDVLNEIMTLPLSGNVRELENLLHRLAATGIWDAGSESARANPSPTELQITTPVTNQHPAEQAALGGLQTYLDDLERDILLKTLEQTGYNRTAAAAKLGISLRQIRYRIGRLNIPMPGDANHDG